ncbi:MAG: hypothetical protein ACRDV6_02785 [Acidimicrobiales bacterium]
MIVPTPGASRWSIPALATGAPSTPDGQILDDPALDPIELLDNCLDVTAVS